MTKTKIEKAVEEFDFRFNPLHIAYATPITLKKEIFDYVQAQKSIAHLQGKKDRDKEVMEKIISLRQIKNRPDKKTPLGVYAREAHEEGYNKAITDLKTFIKDE